MNESAMHVCGCRFYKSCYVRSQEQWVLLYAPRSEVIRVPTRQFKWDSGREWAECCFNYFSKILGLGFESEAIPAVNNTEWEVQFGNTAIHFYLRSGESVLKQFSFLETHLPMAGKK